MLFIKNIRIKVKFIAFAFFSLAINLVFSQNKKEQIEALNFRLDSLHNILTISKISFSDSLFTERFNSKQQRILIEQQKTEMVLQILQSEKS